jgi:hypothetical protein
VRHPSGARVGEETGEALCELRERRCGQLGWRKERQRWWRGALLLPTDMRETKRWGGREWGERDWGVVGNDRRGVWRRQERADGTVASGEISVVYEATSVRMDTCVLA